MALSANQPRITGHLVGTRLALIMRCSVLQYVAVYCSMLHSAAKTGILSERDLHRQCDGVCCSVLQCVAVCCTVLHCIARSGVLSERDLQKMCCHVLQCLALCCTMLHCVAKKSVLSEKNLQRYGVLCSPGKRKRQRRLRCPQAPRTEAAILCDCCRVK